jgi:TonB-linked SusC/RagA family outer membrane protein
MKKIATRSWSRAEFYSQFRPPAQMMKTMKLFAFFLFVTLISAHAEGTAQSITLSAKDMPVKQVFAAIEQQTGYVVFYRQNQLEKTRPVTVTVSNIPLKSFLDIVLRQQQLDFKIEDKTIVLSARAAGFARQKQNVAGEFVAVEAAPPLIIRVTDSLGNPVENATVYLRVGNTTQVETTDKFGVCKLTAKEGDVINIRLVGYEMRTIQVKKAMLSEGTLTVALKQVISKLEDVEITVNTGYQRIRPEQSTGAIAQLSTKEYESRVSTDFLDGLVNKLPGLMINNNVQFTSTDINGVQTSRSLFNIRGISTMSANQNPLIVIDGFPTELTMDMIDPNEIKSVTILKDAAAATIYGVRASNGVIVIERKQAAIGKPRFSFRATAATTPKENYSRYRWEPNSSAVVTNYERNLYGTSVNADTWSNLITKTTISGVPFAPVYYIMAQSAAKIITPNQADKSFADLANYNNATDYSKLFERSALTQTYNMDISGGNPNALYYITANYTGNKLTQIKNDNNRILLSGRTTLKFSSRLSLELTTDYQEEHYNAAPVPGISSVYPYEHFEDVNGKPSAIALGSGGNPYYNNILMSKGLADNLYYPLTDVNEVGNKTHTINDRIAARFDYLIGSGFDLTFGGIYETSRTDTRHLASGQSSEAKQYANSYVTLNADGTLNFNMPLGGFLQQEADNTSSYTVRTQLNYNKKIGKFHSINAIVGAEVRDVITSSNVASYFGYNDQTLLQQPINYAGLVNGTIVGAFISTRTLNNNNYSNYFNQQYAEDRYLSGYTNIVYSYKNTYSLTGSIRIDQSNLFGTNPKYKYKPLWSVGTAWNINKENFMRDVSWVKLLKLRAAYGFNGNVAKMSLPQVIAQYTINSYTSPGSSALKLLSYANSSLRWEQTNNFNIGLDYTLIKNISGSIDYYTKKSTDLLGNSLIDPTIGVSPSLINKASINNSGIEFSLHADWIATKNLNWNTGIVLARNTSKVLNVYHNNINNSNYNAFAPQNANLFGYVQGYPVGALFAYRSAGLDSTGNPLLKSTSGKFYSTQHISTTVDNAIANSMGSDTAGLVRYMGSSIPTINIGLSNRVDIGNFYIYCMVNYYGGFKVVVPRPNPSALRPLVGAGNYWKQAGDEKTTDVMALIGNNYANSGNAYKYADNYVVNGDYLTLGDLTLSYSLDRTKFIRNTGFTHFEVKMQTSNIWTVGLNKYNYSMATGTYAKKYLTPTYTFGIFTNF